MHQKPLLISEPILHVVCWGVPLLVAVLPYTTNMYGKSDDDNTWCFITNRSNSPSWGRLFWVLCSFYIWLWLAVIINFALVFSVTKRLRAVSALNNDSIKSQITKLWLYPAVAIFCWTPSTIMDLFRSSRSGNTTCFMFTFSSSRYRTYNIHKFIHYWIIMHFTNYNILVHYIHMHSHVYKLHTYTYTYNT